MTKTVLLIVLVFFPVGVWGAAPEVDAIVKPSAPTPRAEAIFKTAREDIGIDGFIDLPPPDLEAVRADVETLCREFPLYGL